jgi:hypothetical protein
MNNTKQEKNRLKCNKEKTGICMKGKCVVCGKGYPVYLKDCCKEAVKDFSHKVLEMLENHGCDFDYGHKKSIINLLKDQGITLG